MERLELKEVQKLEGHTDRVWSLDWNPATGHAGVPLVFASCSGDKTVRIWEQNLSNSLFSCKPGNEFECVSVLQGHTQDVKMVRHCGDHTFVFGNQDTTVCGNNETKTSSNVYEANVYELLRNLSVLAPKNGGFSVGFVERKNVTVYGLAQCWKFVTGGNCRRCLEDAVTRIGSSCRKKEDGRALNSGCYLRHSPHKFYNNSSSNDVAAGNRGHRKMAIILAASSAVLALLLVTATMGFFIRNNVMRKRRERKQFGTLLDTVNKSKLNVPYEILEKATNYFNDDNKLGQGGSGSVYKGVMLDGNTVAVKRLSFNSTQWVDHFFNEVNLISGVHHKNDERRKNTYTSESLRQRFNRDSGLLCFAVKLFDEMCHRDLVSWSTLIGCFVNNNLPAEAISIFQHMQLDHPDIVSSIDGVIMLSVLSAVSRLGVLELGIWVHSFISRMQLFITASLGAALINMYSRCGSIDRSVKVFDEMPHRNVVTWTALINGLAVHGRSKEALKAFYDMKESGLKPDRTSFIGVLVACSHGGLVEDGWRIFESMTNEFGIEPMLEHYGCMVDLLGRAGLLVEAFEFVEKMPVKPNSVIWRTLLGACVNHNHLLLAEKARERVNELDPHHDGDYVLLSNAYGGVGNWGGKAGLRNSLRQNRIAKEPGLSFIHIDQMVHEFVSGDHSHPQWEKITNFLVSVIDTLKLGGYTPNTSSVLHDIQEEEKEHCVGYHSEKLAVAFVLLYRRDRKAIRVIKNLRICNDCHDFMKHVSGILK
ncbi:unnamed protein product [Vicia faba]|uniref:Gnk2-homologous domain-containing protein n=1 Tax=Vicia faba TaxID=3906 RepID=A0AAV1ALF0_VICFA|nr:unnamed protein product [Vicia faba]